MVEVLLSGVKPFTGKKRYLDAPVTSESHLNKLQHLNSSNILKFSSSSHYIYSVYCTLIIHEYVNIQHDFWLTDRLIPCLFYHKLSLNFTPFCKRNWVATCHSLQTILLWEEKWTKKVASNYMFPINTNDMQPRYFERFSSTMPYIYCLVDNRCP